MHRFIENIYIIVSRNVSPLIVKHPYKMTQAYHPPWVFRMFDSDQRLINVKCIIVKIFITSLRR